MITTQKYGPWAVIAGGSEGIGESFAHKLGRAGLNLVLIARKPEQLEKAAREVRAAVGVQVRTLQLDLARPDVLDRVREVTDDIDVGMLIFNAAAGGSLRPFHEQPLDQVLLALRVSGISQTSLAHHFGAKMVKRGRGGGIILVGSLAGNAGAPNIATYCGVKAYTQMLGEALWSEMKPHGIDVEVLVLGATDTPSRTRSGTADVPGMPVLTSDEVAQQALDNLDNGPVQVPPPLAEMFKQICSLPRRQVAEMMSTAVPAAKQN